jgi:hypothetical protein
MGITSQVVRYVFGSAEWRLSIDNPVLAIKSSDKTSKLLLVGQVPQMAIEVDLSLLKSFFESRLELAAKHAAEHFDGKEKRGRDACCQRE